ncbi:winged helix-turn-helix domain-containing protein [Candidatus Saccharibacteria bacterium]|nr:winged helix-turn-helix domain-containing protein [Candidatus Saccharibacteria bacterium]
MAFVCSKFLRSCQTTFTLRITKTDLASQIGVRPETLSRLLKRLQDNRSIQLDRKTVTLLATQ